MSFSLHLHKLALSKISGWDLKERDSFKMRKES